MHVVMLDSGTAEAWVDRHELTHPVIEMPTDAATAYWFPFLAYPSGKLLKPDMVVHDAGFNPANLGEAQLKHILP
ncbi:MAG: hypothetical protein B7733_17120 [Myxococcales bacterium FL481]|nr:MAG: hypothetical protein B7733_17120 [Myxococcales bacterium FL481]